MDYIYHHGILGQRWGIRRFQNPDGSLTPAGRRRLARKDMKWVGKNSEKIYRRTYNASRPEFNDYLRNDLNKRIRPRNADGSISSNYLNAYNRKLAELMNKNVGDIEAPSGRVVQFVANRGRVGVSVALADRGYDMSQVKNGVWSSGKIAYKKKRVEMA